MFNAPQRTTDDLQVLKYRALLEVSKSLASHYDLAGLFRNLSEQLRLVVDFEAVIITLYDPQKRTMRRYLLESEISDLADLTSEVSVENSLAGFVWQTQKPYLLRGAEDAAAFPPLMKTLQDNDIRSACILPLTSSGHGLGTIGFGSRREGAYSEDQLEFLQLLANQVAVAIDNARNFEQARAAEQQAKRQSERERLILEINNAVVSQLELRELVRVISSCLREALQLDIASVSLYDPEINQLRAYWFDLAEVLPPVKEGTPFSLDGNVGGLAFTTGKPIFINRTNAEKTSSDFDRRLIEAGIRSGGCVPLIVQDRKLGILAVGSFREDAFSEADQDLLIHIANQIAIAVDNALNFERARKSEQQAIHQSEQLQLLLEINNAVVSNLDLSSLLKTISSWLRQLSHYDSMGVALYDEETNQLRTYANPSNHAFLEPGRPIPMEGTIIGMTFTTGQPVLLDRLDDERFHSDFSKKFREAGFKSGGCVPLIAHNRKLGTLGVASYREIHFSKSEVELLCQIANQVAIAVENALAYSEIESLKNKLASEKLYLEQEIQTEYNFAEIIGQSTTLKRILKQVETVAPTDSVVLIQGETGTGKELIARAIHNLSARRERTMVKLNCAAIPTGLLESELFGHEKGAFTGAVSQRVGRFELAHKGTLFLDEVGDIPLELQPKLLRVLQESEFERLGSSRTIRADVRLIAATNCDLAQMVEEKKFRGDLFYRLNVFPLRLPPLRERLEDIPLLVGYFIQKHSRRMNKRITTVRAEDLEALGAYHWSGNVRELENFIERAVILSKDSQLVVPLTELRKPTPAHHPDKVSATPSKLISLEANERAHIQEILRHTNGVIGGKGGAAEILDLPVSTLRSRMKKLGLI